MPKNVSLGFVEVQAITNARTVAITQLAVTPESTVVRLRIVVTKTRGRNSLKAWRHTVGIGKWASLKMPGRSNGSVETGGGTDLFPVGPLLRH
jgi:hypothetical protein